MEHELSTLPKHMSSPPFFSGVHVTRSLVLCVCFVVIFVLFSLVCPSIYGFPNSSLNPYIFLFNGLPVHIVEFTDI